MFTYRVGCSFIRDKYVCVSASSFLFVCFVLFGFFLVANLCVVVQLAQQKLIYEKRKIGYL